MSNEPIPLSPTQQRVYDLLHGVPGQDVAIKEIYFEAYPHMKGPYTVRHMQQYIGPIIARINAKIAPAKVVPGATKQTYRLNPSS